MNEIKFDKTADGKVRLVGGWPAHVVFSQAFLEQADTNYVSVDGARVVISVDGAEATYMLGFPDDRVRECEARLVQCRQVWTYA